MFIVIPIDSGINFIAQRTRHFCVQQEKKTNKKAHLNLGFGAGTRIELLTQIELLVSWKQLKINRPAVDVTSVTYALVSNF